MGDTMCVVALFTKEAQQEANEKINPKHATSMWITPTSAADTPYKITLDAATAIYAATK